MSPNTPKGGKLYHKITDLNTVNSFLAALKLNKKPDISNHIEVVGFFCSSFCFYFFIFILTKCSNLPGIT